MSMVVDRIHAPLLQGEGSLRSSSSSSSLLSAVAKVTCNIHATFRSKGYCFYGIRDCIRDVLCVDRARYIVKYYRPEQVGP